MKSLLLLSGGLDSSAAVYIFKKSRKLDCLFIDYNQKAAKMELRSARTICDKNDLRLINLKIKELGKLFVEGEHMIPHVPIKHRNIILVSIALVYAKEKGYEEVILANVNEDCVYEQNKPKITSKLIELARELNVKLTMPFIGLSKSLVLKMGIKEGLNPEDTYSCMLGHKKHCGLCSQCELRKKAFLEANLKDPTSYMF